VAIDAPSLFAFLADGRPDRSTPIATHGVEVRGDTIAYRDLNDDLQYLHLPELLLPIDKLGQQARAWRSSTGKPYLLGLDGNVHYVAVSTEREQTVALADLQATFEEAHWVKGHFWLGSDASGRDVLSRLILGTRVSLGIGLMAVLVSLLLGVSLGALAGFFRGWVDRVIMWFVSVVWSIPTLLLAIALAFVLGKGTWQLFVVIGISSWVEVARLVRGQIFAIREQQYVEATQALGYRWPRVILRHILPNLLSPLIIVAAANFASAILMEAGLSFLGVGVQPPAPSWGSMIKDGYAQIMFDSGIWLAILPGLAMILVVISLNLVGFGLRDALDPKQRQ
jgi:peptide/nickel transport system permease protein